MRLGLNFLLHKAKIDLSMLGDSVPEVPFTFSIIFAMTIVKRTLAQELLPISVSSVHIYWSVLLAFQ